MPIAWFENPTILTAIAGIIVAFITSFFGWWAGRRKSNADADAAAREAATRAQIALVTGFRELISEFKDDRVDLIRRIDELETDRESLENRVRHLERHVNNLEHLLTKNGIDLPLQEP